MGERELRAAIDPRRVCALLAGIAAGLVALSVGSQLLRWATGYESVYGLIPLFGLDYENNLPTFYSTVLLLLAAAAAGGIAGIKRGEGDRFTRHWWGLALLMLYLAVDEAASLHELWMRPMRELLGGAASGLLFLPWVVPGIALVGAVGLFFLRFWWSLPPRSRWLVALSAVLYVGGAIGLEISSAQIMELQGTDHLAYRIVSTLEESLEMGGVIVLIFALLEYAQAQLGDLQLLVRGRPPRR